MRLLFCDSCADIPIFALKFMYGLGITSLIIENLFNKHKNIDGFITEEF